MPDRPYHVYVIQGRGQRDYTDCMTPLGYAVSVWKPGAGDPSFKNGHEERN